VAPAAWLLTETEPDGSAVELFRGLCDVVTPEDGAVRTSHPWSTSQCRASRGTSYRVIALPGLVACGGGVHAEVKEDGENPPVGDACVGHPLRHQSEYVVLPLGELGQALLAGVAVE
jgi:hypothetical protein